MPVMKMKVMVTLPYPLWSWLVVHCDGALRDVDEVILHMLEQLKRDEEAAAGDKPAS